VSGKNIAVSAIVALIVVVGFAQYQKRYGA
jgi:hypothetical protein